MSVTEPGARTDGDDEAGRLTAVLASQSIAVMEQATDRRLIWASSGLEDIFGFPADAAGSFPDPDRSPPDDAAAVAEHRRRCHALAEAGRTDGRPITFDYRYLTDDGDVRTVATEVQLIERNGQPVLRTIGRDVTETQRRVGLLEAMNGRLVGLNQSLSDFVQVASHDLRAPLRHLRTLVAFLRDDFADQLPPAAIDRVAAMDERVATMDELVVDLLDYARSGSLERTVQAVDLQRLLSEAVDLVAHRDRIGVEVRCAIDPVEVATVPLATCVRNLVDNAVRHHPGPDGRIVVRATRRHDDLVVVVTDDGAGIDERFHRRIFEPFQSLSPGGSGLGLATVRRITDQYGATIELESEPGQGTTFTITWPLTIPGEGPARPVDRGVELDVDRPIDVSADRTSPSGSTRQPAGARPT